MADKALIVSDGLVLSLEYTLQLDDGEIVDTSAGDEPLEHLQRYSQVIPGLEQAFYGLAVGMRRTW